MAKKLDEEQLAQILKEKQRAEALAGLGAFEELQATGFPMLSEQFPESFAKLKLLATKNSLTELRGLLPTVNEKATLELLLGKIRQVQKQAAEIVRDWLEGVEPVELTEQVFIPDENEIKSLEIALKLGLFELIHPKRMEFLSKLPEAAILRYRSEALIVALEQWRRIEDMTRTDRGFSDEDDTRMNRYAKDQIRELAGRLNALVPLPSTEDGGSKKARKKAK